MALVKHRVCAACYSVGITAHDCVCTYQRGYPTIELEFEQCDCCGRFTDGQPADSPANEQAILEHAEAQLKKMERPDYEL